MTNFYHEKIDAAVRRT